MSGACAYIDGTPRVPRAQGPPASLPLQLLLRLRGGSEWIGHHGWPIDF